MISVRALHCQGHKSQCPIKVSKMSSPRRHSSDSEREKEKVSPVGQRATWRKNHIYWNYLWVWGFKQVLLMLVMYQSTLDFGYSWVAFKGYFSGHAFRNRTLRLTNDRQRRINLHYRREGEGNVSPPRTLRVLLWVNESFTFFKVRVWWSGSVNFGYNGKVQMSSLYKTDSRHWFNNRSRNWRGTCLYL